jgi:hypothetical protein
VNAHEEAQRFLDQIRAQTHTALNTSPVGYPTALVEDAIDQFRRDLIPERGQDPQLQADIEHMHALAVQGGHDAMWTHVLAVILDEIEKTATTKVKMVKDGPDVVRRPLVGYLRTGQLSAVSMPVPGSSEAYLVLFEQQMFKFIDRLSFTVAWVTPPDRLADMNSGLGFRMSVRDIAERIEAVPEIASRFASIVITYAITGGIGPIFDDKLVPPPDYADLGSRLRTSLMFFVLGHEYAHITMGHLDTASSRKGVLPAAEVEALVYSWQQELDADFHGMLLSLYTTGPAFKFAFLGSGLFFDAMDVMDRAVALLQTGDENARQLGSHPPAYRRKQNLRECLSMLAEAFPAHNAEPLRAALELEEVQGEIIRLLWERARPILLTLHRAGTRPAQTWRTIPKETGHEPAPAPQSASAPPQARRRGLRWGRRR